MLRNLTLSALSTLDFTPRMTELELHEPKLSKGQGGFCRLGNPGM